MELKLVEEFYLYSVLLSVHLDYGGMICIAQPSVFVALLVML